MKTNKSIRLFGAAVAAVSVFISAAGSLAGCAPKTPQNGDTDTDINTPVDPPSDDATVVAPWREMNDAEPVVKGVYSDSFYIPASNNRNWREGFVSGNGENGVITSGVPYADTFIFQHMAFAMPNAQNHDIRATVPDELAVARANLMSGSATNKFTSTTRTYYYGFHPGHQLKISSDEYPLESYARWTDYTTAEVGVTYSNGNDGEWERRTFTSRADNVTVTYVSSSSEGSKVNITLSIDNLSALSNFTVSSGNNPSSNPSTMQYKKLVDEDLNYIAQVAHYPDRGVGESAQKYKTAGYAGVTQVVVVGGAKEKVELGGARDAQNVGEDTNPAIKITDADAVFLVTQSDRTFDMGDISDFASAQSYDIIDELYTNTDGVVNKYTADGEFDYYKALTAHARLHMPEFKRVTFDLNAPEADRKLSNEALIAKQKSDDTALLPAFVERSYYAGRYAQICCSGYSTARLGGMWTGEWDSPWGGMYTVDANVNLQTSAMNTANIEFYHTGYISFILRLVDDWMTNAETVYGMHDAIQASHNTDGDSALMIQSDIAYPFQYWNAGASWLLQPIYEFWQCYGNMQMPIFKDVNLFEIKRVLGTCDGGLTDAEVQAIIDRGYMDLERDVLLPLLTKQSNFWEQLCTPEYYMSADGNPSYTPGKTSLADGERYLILPSTSPENSPSGQSDSQGGKVTINSTMDISAAKNGLEMTIALEKAVNGEQDNAQISKWENLIAKLPEYQYTADATPALKEWAISPNASLTYNENNTHRHLSHLYCAWPLFETKYDDNLYEAAKNALSDRKSNGLYSLTQGHGWVHATLVATRLGDGQTVYDNLRNLARSKIYYTSMMTDHNIDRGQNTYCTDTLLGSIGIVNESLVFSDTGTVCVLPTQVSGWNKGAITGIRTRSRAVINSLDWDTVNGTVTVSITSDINQTLELSCGLSYPNSTVRGCKYDKNNAKLSLQMQAGKTVTVTFTRGA